MNEIIKGIDKAIKQIWVNEIANDYAENFLLKEDTLKNAFYHHLRNRLDAILSEKNLRIYTEFNECGLKTRRKRADLAIVKMKDEPSNSEYLGEDVESVLALIELKFTSGGARSINTIFEDVAKTKNYIQDKKYADMYMNCQFYLGIIHEHTYKHSDLQWLGKRQYNNWAKGRLTELNASYYEDKLPEKIGFSICSYNELNPDMERKTLDDIVFV